MKEQFLHTLFEQKVVKGQASKKVDIKIEVKNKALATHFKQLYKKYEGAYSKNYQAFLNDCMLLTNQAVQNFEIKDAGSWQGMVNGSDKANVARLITSIKTTVKHEIRKLNYRDGYETTRNVFNEKTGKIERVQAFISVKMESIDKLSLNEDNNEVSQQIDALQSFWNEKTNTETPFSEWFNENKANILTASQLELFDKLNFIQYFHAKEVLSKTELSEALDGMDINRISEKLKKISTRINKAWDKEKDLRNKTFVEILLERKIALLQDGLEISDNKALSDFVKENIDKSVFEEVLDKLERNQYLAVAKAFQTNTDIPSRVLYSISKVMQAELEDLLDKLEYEKSLKLSKKTYVKKPSYFKPAEQGKMIFLQINADGLVIQEK